jgi:acetoin utilization deacetylase AcuC-like enzyme
VGRGARRCSSPATRCRCIPARARPEERGAHGQILNLPLRARRAAPEMRAAYERVVFPRWRLGARTDADLGRVRCPCRRSAGGLNGRPRICLADRRLCDLAMPICRGRVVSALEGGYDLDALAASVAAHVGVLEERGDERQNR